MNVLFPQNQPRGLLEHLFLLIGEMDGRDGTTFEEVSFVSAAHGYEFSQQIWDLVQGLFEYPASEQREREGEAPPPLAEEGATRAPIIDSLSPFPELKFYNFGFVQDFLEKLGIVNAHGRFQKDGYQRFKEKMELWKGGPLRTTGETLPEAIQRHETRFQVSHEQSLREKIRERLARLTDTPLVWNGVDLHETGDFLTWILLDPEIPPCKEPLPQSTLQALKECLLHKTPILPTPLKIREAPDEEKPIPNPLVRFEPYTFRMAFPTKDIWRPFQDWAHLRTAGYLTNSDYHNFFGIGWNVQYFLEERIFAEGSLLIGGHDFLVNFDTQKHRRGLLYGLWAEAGVGHVFFSRKFFTLFDEQYHLGLALQLHAFGGLDQNLESWIEFPIVSAKTVFFKVGPFYIQTHVGQSFFKGLSTYLDARAGFQF